MIDCKALKQAFENYKIKKILDSGVLYMFDAKLTKTQHEQIKKNFEKIYLENNQVNQTSNNSLNVIKQEFFENDDFDMIINLKNNLSN